MKRSHWRNLGRAALLFGALVACTACASMMGATKTFTLTDAPPPAPNVRVSLDGFSLEPDGRRVVSLGLVPVSGYDAATQEALVSSLRDTFAAMSRPAADPARALGVHVRVRRYMVASGDGGHAALACVSWALVEGRRVVFSDEFYAASDGGWTMGRCKKRVHQAIVERIASRVAWASRPAPERGDAPATGKTFDSFYATLNRVPQDVSGHVSTDLVGAMLEAFGAFAQRPGWMWARVDSPFDWDAYLAQSGAIDAR